MKNKRDRGLSVCVPSASSKKIFSLFEKQKEGASKKKRGPRKVLGWN